MTKEILKSYVVTQGYSGGPVQMNHSSLAPGYTPAFKETKEEAAEYAVNYRLKKIKDLEDQIERIKALV